MVSSVACGPPTTFINSLNACGSSVTSWAPGYPTVFNSCVPYWFSPWGFCRVTAFPTLVVKEQQWERSGAWWSWSRGQLADIFPDSFAGILRQYIQQDSLAGLLRQYLQLVIPVGPSCQSLLSISSGCRVVTSWPCDCWRISACYLSGSGHHVSSHFCCCSLAFNVSLCSHRGSLKSSLKLLICFLALACLDCLCSPGNAWVQDCFELAALLGLFYPLLIASSYLESACIVQVPDTPNPGLFLDPAVPLGFSPVTIPFFLSQLLSP